MVADVLHLMTVLAIVEPLVLNLPAAFRDAEYFATADAMPGEVGQPVGFDDRAVGLMLAVADDAGRLPGAMNTTAGQPRR